MRDFGLIQQSSCYAPSGVSKSDIFQTAYSLKLSTDITNKCIIVQTNFSSVQAYHAIDCLLKKGLNFVLIKISFFLTKTKY